MIGLRWIRVEPGLELGWWRRLRALATALTLHPPPRPRVRRHLWGWTRVTRTERTRADAYYHVPF